MPSLMPLPGLVRSQVGLGSQAQSSPSPINTGAKVEMETSPYWCAGVLLMPLSQRLRSRHTAPLVARAAPWQDGQCWLPEPERPGPRRDTRCRTAVTRTVRELSRRTLSWAALALTGQSSLPARWHTSRTVARTGQTSGYRPLRPCTSCRACRKPSRPCWAPTPPAAGPWSNPRRHSSRGCTPVAHPELAEGM